MGRNLFTISDAPAARQHISDLKVFILGVEVEIGDASEPPVHSNHDDVVDIEGILEPMKSGTV